MGNSKKTPSKSASRTTTAVSDSTSSDPTAESLPTDLDGKGAVPADNVARAILAPAMSMSLDGDVALKAAPTDAAPVSTSTGRDVGSLAPTPVVDSLIPDMGDWKGGVNAPAPMTPHNPSESSSTTVSTSAPTVLAAPESSHVVTEGATDCMAATKTTAPPSAGPEPQAKAAPAQEKKCSAEAPAASTRPECPPLFAAAWDLEEEEAVFPKRWRVAAWVAAVVGVVCVAFYWGARVTPWNQYLARVDLLRTEPVEDDYSLSEAVQDDAELYRDRKPYQYVSVRDTESPQGRVRGRDGERRGTTQGTASGTVKGPTRITTSNPAPDVLDETARAYAMLGGGYNAAELTTAEPVSKTGKEKVPQVIVRGAQLQGKLDGEITSHIGTPVIVKVTADTHLGPHTVPSGAELHGLVSGSTYGDARIFVRFDFILFEDGSSLDFMGIARDVKGRPGIPGSKLLDGESAKSIGIAGLGGLLAGAGELVGGLGGVVADGAERAAESASAKAERIDRDDLLIVADDGTFVAVYVQSAGAKS